MHLLQDILVEWEKCRHVLRYFVGHLSSKRVEIEVYFLNEQYVLYIGKPSRKIESKYPKKQKGGCAKETARLGRLCIECLFVLSLKADAKWQ